MKCQAMELVMGGYLLSRGEVVSDSSGEEEPAFLHLSFMPLQLLDSDLECHGSLWFPLPNFCMSVVTLDCGTPVLSCA